ncbi:hypothetical protein RYX36_036610 [Vicia faba]
MSFTGFKITKLDKDRSRSKKISLISTGFFIDLNPFFLHRFIPIQHSHEFSYYTQNPKVLLPAVGYRRNQGEKVMSNTSMSNSNVYNNPMVYENNMQKRISEYETLDLFPLHPTGILEGKKTEQVSSIVSVSADSSTDANSGSPHHVINQPFFDFFNNSVGQGS